MRNYLRVRGEYGGRHASENHAKELPPRARRIRLHHPRHHLHAGTTSACAENTYCHRWGRYCHRNYLRVRGEYGTGDSQHDTFVELPPRARRIPPNRKGEDNIMGTTSACAENTPFKIKTNIFVSNYLRVRGEYTRTRKILTRIMELPPRARRIPVEVEGEDATLGTTSACAENTCSRGCIPRRLRNYLRVRGEYPQSRHQSWRR